ncbi:MAG: 50S ribosomal protein L1 [bacterium]
MSKVSKKYKQAVEAVKDQNPSNLKESLEFVVNNAKSKFDESVEVAVLLGIDPSKGEQTVRGAVLLPHGTGKKTRVVAFAKGDHEEEAKKAGTDFVGMEDLIEKIEGGWMDFDAAVATPDLMGQIGKVAKILGPRGLLPNKKVGTVTFEVGPVIEELKKGRVAYKNDKGGIIHASFGKVSFGADKLKENLVALIKAIQSSKPASSKGKFLKKINISSTMGVGLEVTPEEILSI